MAAIQTSMTVFRHFDSATVVKGLVGNQPKTAWVIGYPLFSESTTCSWRVTTSTATPGTS